MVERYLSWAGGVLTGDLGVSLTARKPVAQIVFGRLANTLSLAGFALLLYVPLSILPALVQAFRPDGLTDRTISTVSILILSTPEFLFSTLLLFGLAVAFPIFPPLSQVSAAANALQYVYMITLPAVSLALLLAVSGRASCARASLS